MASIYIIENKDNGKRYVGKTTLSDPYKRWSQHKYNAKGQWNDMVIGRAINKYGIDSFTFYVIETCDDNDVDERETYWIEKFNTYYDGYNSTLGGEGVKRDIELAYHPDTKPISCYTLEGEWIKDYKSRGVAASELGLKNSQNITACIKGVTFQSGGYRWSWKDEELVECKKRENIRGKIYGIDKDNNRKEWNSQADCAEELTGKRTSNAPVKISIDSPNNNKYQCRGWYLFRENVDSFIPAQKNTFTSEQARKGGLMSKGMITLKS
jgi:group I intron endonuclease